MSGSPPRGHAPPTSRVWLLTAVLVCACSQRGDPAGALRQPDLVAQPRPTGCIDTPHIGGSPGAPSPGVACGRVRSASAGAISGQVTAQHPSGLPGAGVEGLWVTLHPIDDGPLRLDALPAARASVQTGPHGVFTFSMAGGGAFVIVVRGTPSGPILAAQRLEPDADHSALRLAVPADH